MHGLFFFFFFFFFFATFVASPVVKVRPEAKPTPASAREAGNADDKTRNITTWPERSLIESHSASLTAVPRQGAGTQLRELRYSRPTKRGD